mgnify:FL=1|tara:strand:- start:11935 stop:12258 length:324 start_codon:yes stop_codon:yes gene_type:complete
MEERFVTENGVDKRQRIVFLAKINTAYMLDDGVLMVSALNPDSWDVALDEYGNENWYELDEREPMTMNTIMVVQKALGIEFVFKNQEPIFIDGYKVVNKKASVRKIY